MLVVSYSIRITFFRSPSFIISFVSFLVLSPAVDQQQSVDAALLHLVPPDRQLLRPQYVRGRGGGELPQVSAAPGSGGGEAQGGEAPASHGKEEEK